MKRKMLFGGEAALLDEEHVGAGFAVTARVRGQLDLAELRHALARLQTRHPALSGRAVVEAGEVYLTNEGAPAIPVRVVGREHDDDWVREVEQEIQRPTRLSTGRLCRMVWVRGVEVSDLILVVDHSAGDGRAGIVALRDLLALIADQQLLLEPLEAPPLKEVLPPALLSHITSLAPPANEGGDGNPWGRPAPPQQPLRVIPLELTADETTALQGNCRAEGVSVQAALCAAFLTPFAEHEPGRPAWRVETPVDLRSRLAPPPYDAVNNYISLVTVPIECAPGRSRWAVAREARDLLAAALADEPLFGVPMIVFLVTGRMPPGALFALDFDLSISNLGRVDIPAQQGPLRLESIYAPTLHIAQDNLRILGVTTYAGQLRATFTSRDPRAPALVARGLEVLREMLCA